MTNQPMCPNEALKHLCKGCQKRRFTYIKCSFHANNQIEMCPCTICLVKMICNDPCEDRGQALIEALDKREDLRKEWADRMMKIERQYKNESSM